MALLTLRPLKDEMRNHLICVCLIMYAGCDLARAQPWSVHIDACSVNRTVCRLKFDKITSLVVDAKRVDAEKQRSRVNIERYTACPYNVAIKYAGLTMRMDFSNEIGLENVRNYDPATHVNTGYFVYDGESWKGTRNILPDADTRIEVESNEQYELVTGTVHRQGTNSKIYDYCFAFALVDTEGYATGGVCTRKKSDLLPLIKLFKKTPVTSDS